MDKSQQRIKDNPHVNRLVRGPKYLQIPFYELTHQFWPDRKLLREEAEQVRLTGNKGFTFPIIDRECGKCVLEFQFSDEGTPVLNEYLNNFLTRYGDLGKVRAHYFYIDENMNYMWHIDNIPSIGAQNAQKFVVQCCINVVITDDESECEFSGFGMYKYKAGVLNTSHLHRVTPKSNRILARISFLDSIYEEVVHRIRKIDGE